MSGFQELKEDQSSAQSAKTQSGMKKRKPLTQERVRELFDYDPETGIVTRRVSVAGKGPTRAGDEVGFLNDSGYLMISYQGRRYRLHRIIWMLIWGYFPEHEIDHINRVRTDNRLCNLREVTRACNSLNSSVQKRSSNGVTGVAWDRSRKKWMSYIRTEREKTCNLGRSEDFIEAVALRLAGEQSLERYKCNVCSSAYQYMQKYLNGELDDKTSN